MKLTGTLAHDCPTGPTCPRIEDTDGDTVIVQGATVTDPAVLAELGTAAHESAVEVPRSLIYGNRILDLDELVEWLGQRHTRDLFRLETRSAYAVDSDGDDYRRYLRGDGEPNAAAKLPWLDTLASDTANGRIWRKVHLVRGPLTDYERYEFEWGFAYNVQAGERIRVLEVDDEQAAAVAELGDFFVLDGVHVLRNLYDDAGGFLGGEVIYGGEAAALRALVGWLWASSHSFTEWWAAHPQYHRRAA